MAKPNFLDTDSSILEKNLKFIKNEVEDELDQIFGSGSDQKTEVSAPPRDYKVVTPKPGTTFRFNKEILEFEEGPPSFIEEFRFPESLTECLLDAIRERPTLWHVENVNYRNREMRKNLWLEVLNQLELTEEYLTGVRKKWDRLKTAYARSKQSTYNNYGRKYKYSDHLSFLEDAHKPRPKKRPTNYITDCDTSSASSCDFHLKKQSSKRKFSQTTTVKESVQSKRLKNTEKPKCCRRTFAELTGEMITHDMEQLPTVTQRRLRRKLLAIVDEAVMQYLTNPDQTSQQQI